MPLTVKLFIAILLLPLSASALTIVPEAVESRNDGKGGTNHQHINCLFRTSGNPNLIQCYITISANLVSDLNVHLTLNQEGECLAGVSLDGYAKNPDSIVFNFALHPDLLKESHVDIHCEAGYFQIETNAVEVIEIPIADDIFGGGNEEDQREAETAE